VNRFNYLAPAGLARWDAIVRRLRDPALRRPFFAFAIATVLVGIACAVEDRRLDAAARRLAVMRAREATIARPRSGLRALSDQIERLKKIDDEVRLVRLSGRARVAELAAIGNSLPPHVWLDTIRQSENGWAITGGARAVADVGSAMLALERAAGVGATTLVWARGGERDASSVRYEMRLGRGR
jgi:Tfp pilus assembly protein PilN